MIKFDKNSKRGLWVGSDFHFGHDKYFIYEKRGFKTIQEHDDALIANINGRIGENDTLIHLGDFALKLDDEGVHRIVERINCKNIICLKGNHENSLIKYLYSKRSNKITLLSRMEEFKYVVPSKVKGEKARKYRFVLSHFPLAVWAGVEFGYGNLCGHSHNSYPPSTHSANNGKILDCGVESALDFKGEMIYNMDEILEIMSRKGIVINDRVHGGINE